MAVTEFIREQAPKQWVAPLPLPHGATAAEARSVGHSALSADVSGARDAL